MALILAAMTPVRVIINDGSAWPTVVVGLAGVVTTLAAAIGVVLLAQRSENRRWNAQQVAFANAAQADRLREVYARMAQASTALRQVIGERSFVVEGESIEQRNERHERDIVNAMNRVAELGGQILIELSAQPVRDTYSTLVSVVRQYITAEEYLPAGTDRAKQLQAFVDAAVGMSNKVVSLATEHLAELDRPAQIARGSARA